LESILGGQNLAVYTPLYSSKNLHSKLASSIYRSSSFVVGLTSRYTYL
jgi:hypothetical protein